MPFDDAISQFHKIPRLSFGMYPTPIEEMPRLRATLGPSAPRLFIKRDDYTGPGFGGNKVRKLEYVLARAKRDGADTVLTVGNIRSNHARVTSAFAARLGFDCHLILNGKTQDTPASKYLEELCGATVHLVSASQIRVPAMQQIAADLREGGRKTVEIPLGASNALGAMGYVSAAEEIASDGRRFDAIFLSSSSGGTQAGLDAGCQLFSIEARLFAVSPDESAETITGQVAEIRDGIAEALALNASTLLRPLEVDAGYVGPGYGIPTPEADDALRLLARTEGVILDPTYTAKAMAALLARVRQQEFSPEQSVLFLHTGGQLGLFSSRQDL